MRQIRSHEIGYGFINWTTIKTVDTNQVQNSAYLQSIEWPGLAGSSHSIRTDMDKISLVRMKSAIDSI